MKKNLFNLAMERLNHSIGRIRNENLQQSILQAIPFFIASILTGIVAVFYAKLFNWSENLSMYIFHLNKWYFFIFSPLCFISAWLIVKLFAHYAQGSGIPQVMAAIELSTPQNQSLLGKLLSIRIIIVKILSSLVLVFGGGAIGREGPTIQIAGSIFKKIYDILPNWWPRISKRNMITAGSAAGLAAAFNTPLGGIVFALEELTKTHLNFFKTAIFTAVILAGLTAQGLAGPYLYLGYPVIGKLSYMSFIGISVVAIISGLMGSILSKLILWIFEWKSKFKTNWKQILFLILCSYIIVILALTVSEKVLGSGKDLMSTTLFSKDKYSEWYVPLLRIVGPLLSFTSGSSAGIFAPSLSAGASIGSVIAGWFHLSASDTNIIILGGMVAFLTGVTRSPFTSAILVLEMTDRHSLIFHLILAGMIASLISILIDKDSLYDHLKQKYLNELTYHQETEIKNE